jgi:Zn-finger nucleic acid-binding protein
VRTGERAFARATGSATLLEMQVEARVYHCAECGGSNAEAARHCTFCRSPLASLRCGHCFHMNAPEHEYCSGCGELLGLEPIALPSELSCPGCELELVAFDGDPGNLFDCSRCGGQFVEHTLLSNLIERRRRYSDGRSVRSYTSIERKVRYLPCPACADLMNRRNFGGTSGIIVDYCGHHGVWFHPGALPRLLGLVARGGLADGRRIRLGLKRPESEAERQRTAMLVARSLNKEEAARKVSAPSAREVAEGVLQGTIDLLETLGSFILHAEG